MSSALASTGFNATDLLTASGTAAPTKLKANTAAKARAAAQDFEAVFLNSMFQHMFTDMKGEGPMGGSGATGVWRSMLVDQYAKNVAKAGGVGIADQVYKSLMAQQEVRQ